MVTLDKCGKCTCPAVVCFFPALAHGRVWCSWESERVARRAESETGARLPPPLSSIKGEPLPCARLARTASSPRCCHGDLRELRHHAPLPARAQAPLRGRERESRGERARHRRARCLDSLNLHPHPSSHSSPSTALLVGLGAGAAGGYLFFGRQIPPSRARPALAGPDGAGAEGGAAAAAHPACALTGVPAADLVRPFPGFVVGYDARARGPRWVAERLTHSGSRGGADR